MKTIGLLGGTSWPSTIDYYRILNELAQERFGGHHSADLILRSIDYHEIKSRYHEGWEEIPALLGAELSHLARLATGVHPSLQQHAAQGTRCTRFVA